MAIVSFSDRGTQDLYHGRATSRVRRMPRGVLQRTLLKLDVLNAAANLDDLAAVPGNNLEPLKGRLAGFHSIRVNDQWRIIFRWTDKGAASVRLTDYH